MDYRELGSYQMARKVVSRIDHEIKNWPRTMPAQEISRQLLRAAASTAANIAEGHGRHIGREYAHFLIIAQGSSNEVDHWLNTALDCKIGNPESLAQIIALNNESRKMLAATIRTLNEK